MSDKYDPRINPQATVTTARGGASVEIDQGLRSYMLGVYNMMALGVALTGVVAWAFGNVPALNSLLYTATANGVRPSLLFYVAAFSPLAFILVMSFGVNRMGAATLQTLFWVFAAVMGVSMSSIFMMYTDVSIAKVFFISAAMFGALSLYGYTTKKDLSGWGTFLFMGLIGLILASIVNLFLASGPMSFIISVVGVLVFAGLTAYDTQMIKSMYYEADDSDTMSKKITLGALSLYLDFINMFRSLLALFGSRE